MPGDHALSAHAARSSRRDFLKLSAAFASFAVLERAHAAEAPRARFAYVGTYTGHPGGTGNGEGIYLFDVDAQSGALGNRRVAAGTPNPTWIVLHPSRRFLYSINEVGDFKAANGELNGSISAFGVNTATGALTPLNTVASGGILPAHMSVDPSGRWALVANYEGGSFAVLPIHADGSPGEAVDVHRNAGPAGARLATNAPRGSFAVSGHERPHPHMIATTADHRFVLATDLGEDRIYRFRFDATSGRLAAAEDAPFVQMPTGDGPRHFAFHPNGRWFYSLQEEASTLALFHFNAASAALEQVQVVSTLPPDFAGTSYAAELALSPDGRFLYCTNRLHDTVSSFAIGTDGRLKLLGEVSAMGDFPRHCALDPRGDYLYVCNQRSDAITSFRIDQTSGLPEFTGQYAAAGTPAVLVFL
jgi:6-phosphogluconolactonase (cycloisomerase 2 family)